MNKLSSLLLAVLFALVFMSGAVYSASLIDNGSFNDDITGIDFTTPADCSNNWCAKELHTSYEFEPVSVNADGFDADSNSITIYTNQLSSTQWNNFLLYSQDFYEGSRDINFFYKNLSCPDVYFLPADKCYFSYGYVNSAEIYTEVGQVTTKSGTWTTQSYEIPDGNYAPAWRYYEKASHSIAQASVMHFDLDYVQETILSYASSLTVSVDEGTTFTNSDTEFTAEFLKTDDGLPITDANCLIDIEDTNYQMTYGSGVYTYTFDYGATGDYNVDVVCSADSYLPKSDNLEFSITAKPSDVLTVSDLVNVNNYTINDSDRQIEFFEKDEDYFSFALTSTETGFDIFFYFDKDIDEEQYFIYTSDTGDANSWVFDSTLTYGSSANYDDPIQKIPLEFKNSFTTAFTTESTNKKYFRFVKKQVGRYFETITNSSEWVSFNNPSIYTDASDRVWDSFQNSVYTNIYSYAKTPIPEMTSDTLSTGFEFQFTAYSSTPTEIEVGQLIDGVTSTVTVSLSTTPTRYSVPINSLDYDAQLILLSDLNTPTTIYFREYALVPVSYFVDRLNVFKSDGSVLDALLVNGSSEQIIKEATNNMVKTKFLDLYDDLSKIRIESVIEGESTNLVEIDVTDLDDYEGLFDFTQSTPFIYDLNGNAYDPSTPRDILIRATLINDDYESVATQSKTYKLIQYPSFPNDFQLLASPVNKKVGDAPEFSIQLTQRLPNEFIGFDIIIYSTDSSLDSPEYETRIYNSQLACSYACVKKLTIEDWVYEEEKVYFVRFRALFKSEYENFDSIRSNFEIAVPVSYREFETARIMQVFERTDNTYRADEPIQLVLQVRDVPYQNLASRTDVYLTVDQCPSDSGACDFNGTIRFSPKKQIYDPVTGYNYWFFSNLFYKDTGLLFEDGNYLRIRAHITDSYYGHNTASLPVPTLANKCGTPDATFNPATFLMNFLSNVGCPDPASAVVEIGDAEESRILIDEDHDVNGELNHSIVCVKPDEDRYTDTLEQDLICAVIYKRQEQAIDRFTFYLGNDYSDYSLTGAEQQYIEFSIPTESILFNDPQLMRKALESDSSTDSIDTVGELFYSGLDKVFSGLANPVTEAPTYLTDSGLIKNINWDFNWDGTFNPNVFSGMFFVKIEGIKIINQYDYTNSYPDLIVQNPSLFRTWASQNNMNVPKGKTVVTVYSSDMKQAEKFTVSSPLVIYEKPSEAKGNADSLDTNKTTTVIPNVLKFDYIVDMIYFNETASQRKHLPLTLTYVVPTAFNLGTLFGGVNYLLSNPLGWFEDYAIYIAVLIIFAFFVTLMYKNVRSGRPPIVINTGAGGE